jgi:hypothetical protein
VEEFHLRRKQAARWCCCVISHINSGDGFVSKKIPLVRYLCEDFRSRVGIAGI